LGPQSSKDSCCGVRALAISHTNTVNSVSLHHAWMGGAGQGHGNMGTYHLGDKLHGVVKINGCSQPSQKKLRAEWQARHIHHQIQNRVYHYQHGVTSESPSLSSVASALSSCLILLHLSDEDLVRADQSRAIEAHPNCRFKLWKTSCF
jgi:hypothetical protein